MLEFLAIFFGTIAGQIVSPYIRDQIKMRFGKEEQLRQWVCHYPTCGVTYETANEELLEKLKQGHLRSHRAERKS